MEQKEKFNAGPAVSCSELFFTKHTHVAAKHPQNVKHLAFFLITPGGMFLL